MKFLFCFFPHIFMISIRFFETYMVSTYPEIGEKINLKIIRAIRVLRPLKLVSRVPSELIMFHCFLNCFFNSSDFDKMHFFSQTIFRSSSGSFFYFKSNGAFTSDSFARFIRYYHIRDYWIRILCWCIT